jgi:hypothetical protein
MIHVWMILKNKILEYTRELHIIVSEEEIENICYNMEHDLEFYSVSYHSRHESRHVCIISPYIYIATKVTPQN